MFEVWRKWSSHHHLKAHCTIFFSQSKSGFSILPLIGKQIMWLKQQLPFVQYLIAYALLFQIENGLSLHISKSLVCCCCCYISSDRLFSSLGPWISSGFCVSVISFRLLFSSISFIGHQITVIYTNNKRNIGKLWKG